MSTTCPTINKHKILKKYIRLNYNANTMEKKYIPPSSDSESESGVTSSVRPQSSQMSIGSQSSDTANIASQPLSLTITRSFESFHMPSASAKKTALCRTRKRKFHGNRYNKQATEVPDPTSSAMSPNIDSAACKKYIFLVFKSMKNSLSQFFPPHSKNTIYQLTLQLAIVSLVIPSYRRCSV